MPPSAKSKNFRLSKDVVEEISTLTAETLKEDNIESQAADRLHAVVEKVLHKWLDGLGEGAECSFRSGRKLGKQYITLTAAGTRVNPFGNDSDCVLNGGNSVQTLLANIGLAPSYHYVNGENQITIMPKRRKINPLIYLGIALISGILVGLFCRTLSDDMRHGLSEVLIGPLFDTFIGLLIATALPMMFLSLIWGIYSIGDTATLGTLGRKVIGRYFGRIYFTLVICTLVALPFFTFSFSGGSTGGGEFFAIFDMLLGIVPDNLISPFVEGNTLQIIFLAVAFGLAMLILNKKLPVIVQFVAQANSLVQLIMEWITTLLPVIVFISVLNLMLTDMVNNASELLLLFVVLAISVILNIILILGEACIFQKVKPVVFIRKVMPVFLIALTTASSVATFSTNVECCEKRLGISKNLVNFGVPLATAFSRCGHAATFFCVCVFMASYYAVPMTLSWLFAAILTAGLLALAVPPVPGGGIACYSILFLQLGIPVEALGIAVVLEIALDFVSTALNMIAVPADLTSVANKMDMLDRDVLREA